VVPETGWRVRGTESTRPSDSVTDSASRVHDTSTASVSALATKVLMPFLQEEACVLDRDFPNLGNLVRPKTKHVSDQHEF
jgi:hypothetical protein